MLLSTLFASLSLGSGLSLDRPQRLSPPELDLNQLGDVFVGGSGFDGFTKLTYKGQDTILTEPSTDHDAIILSYGDDVFTKHSFANGVVSQSCLGDDIWVLTGNFSEILNTSLPNGIAGIDLTNMSVIDITSSLNLTDSLAGTDIHALWCNGTEIYFGGHFQLDDDTWGVVVYETDENRWSRPKFGGFAADSSVETILPFEDSIIFGGNFSGLISSSTMRSLRGESNQTNATLLKPGMQPVSFNLASSTGFIQQNGESESADSILCPLDPSSGWESGLDSTTGFVNVTLAYMSEPTRVRLYNLADGSGTKTFRIVSEPANSYMNLTYRDDSGGLKSCSAYCPLPEYNSTIRYTDFEFVNVIPTRSLQIQLLDFYGDHAGLKGLELFENGQFVFANNALNSPRDCQVSVLGNDTAPSHTDLSGDGWGQNSDFMSINITDKSKFTSAHADFVPDLESYNINQGLFEVLVYTPGCEMLGTCAQRGIVNVTVYPGFGDSHSSVLYQTNEALKYDLVYNGTLKEGSYIRMTPVSENIVPMDFVAYKVSLRYLGSNKNQNVSSIFEFAAENFTSAYDPEIGGRINSFGQDLGNEASVNALAINGSESILIGGTGFPANVSSSNLISLPLDSTGNAQELDLDGDVEYMAELNGSYFVVTDKDTYELKDGSFNKTDIGAALNMSPISLNGTQYWALTSSNGTYLYDPGLNSIVPASHHSPSLNGRITGISTLSNLTIYSGNVKIVDETTNGDSVLISNSSYESIGSYSLQRSTDKALSKRDNEEESRGSRIYGGAYTDSEHIVLVGHFNATTSNNSMARNAIEVETKGDTNSSSILDSIEDLPNSAVLRCIDYLNGTMAIGGTFKGAFAGSDVQGFILYNVTSEGAIKAASQQPPMLDSNNDVTINALSIRPGTGEIVVGGQFEAGEGVSNGSCTGLCSYDAKERDWISFSGLSLESRSLINSLVYQTSDRLVLAGDLQTSNGSGQVAVYDYRNKTLNLLPSAPVNDEVTQLVVLSNSTESFAISAGSSIFFYDEHSWKSVPNSPLRSGTEISSLSIVPLKDGNGSSDTPFSSDNALLVSGDLKTDDGDVSMAVYDGSTWSSLYAASGSSGGVTLGAVFAQLGGNLKGGTTRGATKTSSSPHSSSTSSPESTNSGHSHGGESGGFMPAGHVVGIACAIGVGCVLLLTLVYLIFEWFLTKGSSNTYQNLAQQKADADPMAGTKIIG